MSDFPVDLVVTYVDDNDAVWQEKIKQYNSEYQPKRFRDWGLFKYWFRCVEQNMPFIRTIHLVVSNVEQVPSWLDQNKAHIVLHEDIIPKHLLPTFNSTTIEMFLCKIEGLAEHFIYSNDDMFAVNKQDTNDFFKDGKPIYELIERTVAKNCFRMQCKNSYKFASQLANHKMDLPKYFYIKHSMDPMLKSMCEEVWQKGGDEIMRRCTKFREPFNFTQYLFPDYTLLKNNATLGKYSFKYFVASDESYVQHEFENGDAKTICINDSNYIDDFKQYSALVKKLFEKKLPEKSRFERDDS